MSERMILLAVIAQAGGDRYYSTEQYATRNGDTPANVLFEGRLVDAVYERSASFAQWNRGGGTGAVSYLELINTDGGLDSWLAEDWKDVRVTLKMVSALAAYSTATQLGVCVIDRIVAPSQTRVRLVCRSVFERLEQVITNVYPDTITNEGLRGKPKPITLGRVRWVQGLNPTLNDSGGSQRGVWDLCDGPFESITELRANGALQTESQARLVTNSSPQYFIIQDESPDEWTGLSGYGYFLREQDRRQAAEVRGQLRRGTNILTDSTFPTGSGSDPANWDVVEGGGGSVTWNSAGVVTIIGDGANATYIAQDNTITNGQLYQLELEISTLTGVLSMYYNSTIIRSIDSSNAIRVSAVFTGVGGTDDIRIGFSASAGGTAVIQAVRLFPVYRINTLAEIVSFAAVTRGQLSAGDLDAAALAAIDTAASYDIGWHSMGAEVRGIDLVNLASRSFGCSIFQNRSGDLVPVRIAAPSGSADFTLDEFSITDIGYEADDAPGLSAKMYYGRNYSVHSVEETDGLSAATYPELRAELQQDARVVTTTVTLDTIYAEATSREPLDSILSEEADAQAEIDRLCTLYATARAFFTIRAFVQDATAHTIEPGHTVAVTHSRYGLSAGRNLLVVAARSDFLGNAVDLVLWG